VTQTLLSRFDEQVRRGIAAEPGFRVERTHRVVRVIGAWNCILHATLDEATVADEVAAQIEHFRGRSQAVQWKVYSHDEPRSLPEVLTAAGFTLAETETLMVLDLDQHAIEASVPSGIEVRRFATADALADVATVALAAFGETFDGLIAELEARLPLGTLAFYLAYDGALPVAAARLEMPQQGEFAGLYGGGTVPAYRGRGIYRSLVQARAQEARARGYRYLNIEAASASKRILERLGFAAVSVVSTWHWQPS
jgi:predicted GNAT family acetyltransferase